MNRLQSNRDFQLGPQYVAELYALVAAKLRMVLNDHRVVVANTFSDRLPVSWWNRLSVEEVPTVVKLDVLRAPQLGHLQERMVNLIRNRSERNTLVRRVLPQVAHQTTKRTLAVRQEQSRNIFDLAVGTAFGFDVKCVRSIVSNRVFRSPNLENVVVGERWEHVYSENISANASR